MGKENPTPDPFHQINVPLPAVRFEKNPVDAQFELALHEGMIDVSPESARDHVKGRMEALLTAYLDCKQLVTACRRSGVSWQAHEVWLKEHPEYKAALKSIDRMHARELFGREYERALIGESHNIKFILGKLDPETFREDRAIGVNVNSSGGPIQVITGVPQPLPEPQEKIVDAEQGAPAGGGPSVG